MVVKPIIYSAICCGLIVAGAYVTIPLGPVPFVLSDFFVLLAGLVLGWKYGPLSIGLYLLLGAFGLPVFANGGGGLDHFAGPTGGYLVGFFFASFIVGLLSHIEPKSIWKDFAAVVAGYLTIYSFGVVWLKLQTDLSWAEAISSGCLEFLVPMAIKTTGCVLLAQVIRKLKLI